MRPMSGHSAVQSANHSFAHMGPLQRLVGYAGQRVGETNHPGPELNTRVAGTPFRGERVRASSRSLRRRSALAAELAQDPGRSASSPPQARSQNASRCLMFEMATPESSSGQDVPGQADDPMEHGTRNITCTMAATSLEEAPISMVLDTITGNPGAASSSLARTSIQQGPQQPQQRQEQHQQQQPPQPQPQPLQHHTAQARLSNVGQPQVRQPQESQRREPQQQLQPQLQPEAQPTLLPHLGRDMEVDAVAERAQRRRVEPAAADAVVPPPLPQPPQPAPAQSGRVWCPVATCRESSARRRGFPSNASMVNHINMHVHSGEVGLVSAWMVANRKEQCRLCRGCVAVGRGIHPTCVPVERSHARSHVQAQGHNASGESVPQPNTDELPSMAEVVAAPARTLKRVPFAARATWAQVFTRALAAAATYNSDEAWLEVLMLAKAVLLAPPRGGKKNKRAAAAFTLERLSRCEAGHRESLWEDVMARRANPHKEEDESSRRR